MSESGHVLLMAAVGGVDRVSGSSSIHAGSSFGGSGGEIDLWLVAEPDLEIQVRSASPPVDQWTSPACVPSYPAQAMLMRAVT